jgi:hypothetical protein
VINYTICISLKKNKKKITPGPKGEEALALDINLVVHPKGLTECKLASKSQLVGARRWSKI